MYSTCHCNKFHWSVSLHPGFIAAELEGKHRGMNGMGCVSASGNAGRAADECAWVHCLSPDKAVMQSVLVHIACSTSILPVFHRTEV